MNNIECPHLEELKLALVKCTNLQDVEFELEDIENCKECLKNKSEICDMWINLSIITNLLSPQYSDRQKLDFENINKYIEQVSRGLLTGFKK